MVISTLDNKAKNDDGSTGSGQIWRAKIER